MSGYLKDVEPIVERIRRLLAGNQPEIVSAVLADLLAILLAGHRPDLREAVLAGHVDLVRQLIPPNEALIFATRERPEDWPALQPGAAA